MGNFRGAGEQTSRAGSTNSQGQNIQKKTKGHDKIPKSGGFTQKDREFPLKMPGKIHGNPGIFSHLQGYPDQK